MAILQPYMDNLLFESTVPIILVTSLDAQLFTEDPIEFMRRVEDTSEHIYSTRNTMIDLILAICSYKTFKTDNTPLYLHKFLEFCVSNLNQY